MLLCALGPALLHYCWCVLCLLLPLMRPILIHACQLRQVGGFLQPATDITLIFSLRRSKLCDLGVYSTAGAACAAAVVMRVLVMVCVMGAVVLCAHTCWLVMEEKYLLLSSSAMTTQITKISEANRHPSTRLTLTTRLLGRALCMQG